MHMLFSPQGVTFQQEVLKIQSHYWIVVPCKNIINAILIIIVMKLRPRELVQNHKARLHTLLFKSVCVVSVSQKVSN